ncbi:MAG: type II secretion system protein [bacterium]|nr:type II secretion system protein [bacterium]
MNSRAKKGFTLIELLVTVAILTLLVAIGASVFSSTLKNNHDKRRLLDLGSISKALELYRHDWHYYPASTAFPAPGSPLCSPDSSGSPCKKADGSNGKTYLDQVPKDPSTGQGYVYLALPVSPAPCEAYGECVSYALCAWQEGTGTYEVPSACGSPQTCNSTTCKIGLSPP